MNNESLHPAYVAGYLDGEGCISIERQNTHRKTFSYRLRIYFRQASPDVVRQMADQFCGSLTRTRRARRGETVTYWNFIMSNDDAGEFLEYCLGYLIEKKEQAELALEFLRHRRAYNIQSLAQNPNKVEQANRVRREKEDMYVRMRNLKVLPEGATRDVVFPLRLVS